MTDAQRVIEETARGIMALDLDDLSALGAICSELERLPEVMGAAQTEAVELARVLSRVGERIILDECGDIDDPLSLLVHGVAELQGCVSHFGRTGEDRIDDESIVGELRRVAAGEAASEVDGQTPPPAAPPAGPELSPEALVALDEGKAADVDADVETQEGVEVAVAAIDLPADFDRDLFADFTTEAEDHLSAAESALLSLESAPTDAELVNTVFRAFHTIKGAAGCLDLTDVTTVAHHVEDVLDSARKQRLILNPAILDVVFGSLDLLKNLLADVARHLDGEAVSGRDVAGFVRRLDAVVAGDGPPAAADPEVAADGPASPEIPPQDTEAPAPPSRVRRDQHYVRVGTDKLDMLMNMVGELVIAQTQVSQNEVILGSQNQRLAKDLTQLVKISGDLQEISMSMRMVPVRATFERMARQVRDLARKCGKEVRFRMAGEDTELDKNVVEEIVDPLTHMVRNSVDHGIESPEERQEAGKARMGEVRLEAFHKGGNIVIELSDDGRGLDRDVILTKAIERGVAQAGQEYADEEIFSFIFQPGFSTAKQVSDVSGRGVGMDVVRRSIEDLRGKVELRSEEGKGSTVSIRLPLTLAIIDGMVIGVGRERYILPLTSIVRSLRPDEDALFSVMASGEMVKIQGELFPLLRLHEAFGVVPEHSNPCAGIVILVEAEVGRYCLLVDELLGMQQVVIKALDEELRQHRGLTGCAILGDGRVGLILDANGLSHLTSGKSGNGRSAVTAPDLQERSAA